MNKTTGKGSVRLLKATEYFGDNAMVKCAWCGKRFNVSKAREEYNTVFEDEIDYDEQYEGGDICANCAIADTESNMSVGRAIDMVNGDEEYDDDFAQRWL